MSETFILQFLEQQFLSEFNPILWVKTYQKCRGKWNFSASGWKAKSGHYINEKRRNRFATQGRFPFPLIPIGAGNWQIKATRNNSQGRDQRLTLLRAVSLCPTPVLLQGQSLSHTPQSIQEAEAWPSLILEFGERQST